jgi:hypothetical protein
VAVSYTVDGRTVTTDIDAPAALAFDEVIEGVPARTTVTAVDRAICLALRSDQMLGLLSENSELAQGLFRLLLERPEGAAWQAVVRGTLEHAGSIRPADGLQPIERILVVEEMPIFSRASSAQVSGIAAIGCDAPLKAGDVLVKDGDPPAIFIVITGEIALEPIAGGPPLTAGPGDMIGVYDTLGGAESTSVRVHVTDSGLALRIDREPLFDLITDHIELLQSLGSALIHERRERALA